MDNIILSLPSRVSPEAQAAGAPEALKTGHINYGKDLFDTFAEDDSQGYKVNKVAQWAEAMTCDQFASAVKDAQSIADNTDAACGFKAPEGAKGADKYGPKRLVLNARMSEAKALFGAYKQNPSVLKEKGYWAALKAARDLLDSKGIKWDGTPKPTDADKKAAKVRHASDAALKEAQKLNPQEAGESMKDYILRVADLADAIQENMLIDSLVEKIGKLHDDQDVIMSALFEYIKAQGKDVMEDCAQQLFDKVAEMNGTQSAE